MAIYSYYCNNCKQYFDAKHAIGEEIEQCKLCEAFGTIVRVPSLPLSIKKNIKQASVGNVTKKFIEEAKEELKEQREEFLAKRE